MTIQQCTIEPIFTYFLLMFPRSGENGISIVREDVRGGAKRVDIYLLLLMFPRSGEIGIGIVREDVRFCVVLYCTVLCCARCCTVLYCTVLGHGC